MTMLMSWLCLGLMGWLAAGTAEFVRPEYRIQRTDGPIVIDGRLDEPAWFAAPNVGSFHFPWWTDGEREPTVAKLLWDDRHLYVAQIAFDRHITARYTERDGPISKDDCFEVMLAPDADRPNVYFNLEWNVIGGLIDNFRPQGAHQPRAPRWDAEGVLVAGTYRGTLNEGTDSDQYWITEVAIPFENFRLYAKNTPPQPGDRWNLNLNRHGGDVNAQYSQWSPGDTPKPAFHTPHRFGRVVFEGGSGREF